MYESKLAAMSCHLLQVRICCSGTAVKQLITPLHPASHVQKPVAQLLLCHNLHKGSSGRWGLPNGVQVLLCQDARMVPRGTHIALLACIVREDKTLLVQGGCNHA